MLKCVDIFSLFGISLSNVLLLHSCNVSVVVGVDAQLNTSLYYDVSQCEDRIVSQWGEVSAAERSQLRNRVDEILRPLGYETSLVVIRRANSIALYFICMTLSAVMSLRDQWRSEHLRGTHQLLFTFLSSETRLVRVKRLIWPLTDYERCLDFFTSMEGLLEYHTVHKHNNHSVHDGLN